MPDIRGFKIDGTVYQYGANLLKNVIEFNEKQKKARFL